MYNLKEIGNSILNLFYPVVCAGCGTDNLPAQSSLCIKCIHDLPATGFETIESNSIDHLLAGRIVFEKATAQYYFTKQSLIQELMHQFKYRGNKELGMQLGRLMGSQLKSSGRFENFDMLIPLPLFESKQRKRGYNQAAVLCNGISEMMNVPVEESIVKRIMATETQTHKTRIERWLNMEGKFYVAEPNKISNKNILLVDDVITTGATLEACANAILEVDNVKLSIATLCCTKDI
ncbi:MAG: ComF family protein [Niabella sp.]|nr:MAG: ComF family protein [Niabella sp.]